MVAHPPTGVRGFRSWRQTCGLAYWLSRKQRATVAYDRLARGGTSGAYPQCRYTTCTLATFLDGLEINASVRLRWLATVFQRSRLRSGISDNGNRKDPLR